MLWGRIQEGRSNQEKIAVLVELRKKYHACAPEEEVAFCLM